MNWFLLGQVNRSCEETFIHIYLFLLPKPNRQRHKKQNNSGNSIGKLVETIKIEDKKNNTLLLYIAIRWNTVFACPNLGFIADPTQLQLQQKETFALGSQILGLF